MNLPPHDPESEFGVIGCCLLGGFETADIACESLAPDAFFLEAPRLAFIAIAELTKRGAEVNSATFSQQWRTSNATTPIPSEIAQSPESVPGSDQLPIYASSVNQYAQRRRLIDAAKSLAVKARDTQIAPEAVLAEHEAALSSTKIIQARPEHAFDVGKSLVNDLERRFLLKGQRTGVVTGFYDWDKLTDGLQPGEQAIIAARPSVGKTALAVNVIEQACIRDGTPTLFVTAEMSPIALNRRLVSSFCSIPMSELKVGKISGSSDKVTEFLLILKRTPLHFLDAVSGIDITRLAAAIRSHCRRHGVKLVVIDYLQKIHPARRQEKRTYEVGEVSGVLKALAVSTGAAFLTLAQLNRESEKDKGRAPRLSDLADSGQIERDADCVGLLSRTRCQKDPEGKYASLSIAKQRDGELGIVSLLFDGQHCRFLNQAKP